ncbi:MAG TPA: hypothetical protein VG797_03070, partial [Phycisphaerales bacterium]|nr:hypothetical protein [Phycisphaerales bacterium]
MSNDRFVAVRSLSAGIVVSLTMIAPSHAQTTTRVSVGPGGAQGNGSAQAASVSADGRSVAFYSNSDMLVPGDTNGRFDVFVYDRPTATTERVSLSSSGVQGNEFSGGGGGETDRPVMSSDGRYV